MQLGIAGSLLAACGGADEPTQARTSQPLAVQASRTDHPGQCIAQEGAP
jgi:hypothetical protein